MIFKWISKYSVLIIIVLSIASRFPILFSTDFMLDGDECIVGLMAKHFSEGKEIPFYFYGQTYGFSFIEVLTIRFFYAFFGISELAIRLSILCLWTTGIVFFFLSLRKLEPLKNKWIPLILTLLFIFSPTWYLWSMKARGGYITAFAFSFFVIYFIFHKKWNQSILKNLIVGFFLVVIYESQTLWLPGLLPIVFMHFISSRKIKNFISAMTGIAAGIIVFTIFKTGLTDFWTRKFLNLSDFTFNRFAAVPQKLWQSFTGSYNYAFVDSGISHKIFGFSVLILLIIGFGITIKLLLKRKNNNKALIAFALSVFVYVVLIPATNDINLRYLLPLYGFLLYFLFVIINRIYNANSKKIIFIVTGFLILTGAVSSYKFKDFKSESKQDLNLLLAELEKNEIKYTYCEGPLLQWQIMFYSKEQIISRHFGTTDRYPEYIHKVDEAFFENNPRVALVGFFNENNILSECENAYENNTFFFCKKPSVSVLLKRGFFFHHFTKYDYQQQFYKLYEKKPFFHRRFNYENREEWQNSDNISANNPDGRKFLYFSPSDEFGLTFISDEIHQLKNNESVLFFSADFFKIEYFKELLLVISIENPDTVFFYETINLKDYISKSLSAENVRIYINLPKIDSNDFTFAIYLWNNKRANIFYDNFQFKIYNI
jgi:hypothetical protein